MANRFWGLDRRQTLLAFVAAVLVGVVIAVGSTRGGTSSHRPRLSIGQVKVGSTGSPHALWVFGFRTLRFRTDLRRPRDLPVTGFGSLLGRSGHVDMYDPGTGRVGVLDATRNTLEALGTIPGGTAQENQFAPVIAETAGALWLVSAPGTLTRFDRSARRADPPIPLAAGSAEPPITTGVVAAPSGLVAATRDRSGITVARAAPETSAIVATRRVVPAAPFGLDGLAIDGDRIWLVTGSTVFELDADTLAVARTVRVPGAVRTVRGAVVADHTLWMLADDGRVLVRLDPATGRLRTATPLLTGSPRTFRIPASLVTDGTRVFAMVQTGAAADDHAVRIVVYDPTRRAATHGVDLPSSLFAGAVAAT